MSETQVPVAVRRYCTFDEIETWGDGKYRIRIWQGPFADDVALISQIGRGLHPMHHMTEIANYIQEAILHYPVLGFSMFVDGTENKASVVPLPRLEYVSFECFGCRHRLRLFKPALMTRDWPFLEALIGAKVDR